MRKLATKIALGVSIIFLMTLAVPDSVTAFFHKKVEKAVKKGTSAVGKGVKKGTSAVKKAAEKTASAAKKAAEATAKAAKKAAEATAKAAKKAAAVAKKGYEGAKKAAGSAYKMAMNNCGKIPEPGKTACKAQVNIIKRQVNLAHKGARVGGKFVEWQAKQAKGAVTNPKKFFNDKYNMAVAVGLGAGKCVTGPEKCAKDAMELAQKAVKLVQVGKPVTFRSCKAPKVKNGYGYCQKVTVNMKACASVLGEKICVGPGSINTNFKGQVGLITYVNQKDGAIGATLDARQTLRFFIAGKKVAVGLSCQFSKGGKSEWSHVFGYNYQIPAIPPVSSNNILDAAMRRELKKKSRGKRTKKKNGNMKAMSGHAGKVSKKEMYDIIRGSGCSLIPNIMLFKGMPAINLANLGIKITAAVQNWKVKNNNISADFVIKSSVSGQVLGDPVKVAGINVKIPGFGWDINTGNIAKKRFAVKIPIKDLGRNRAVGKKSGTKNKTKGIGKSKVRKRIDLACAKKFKARGGWAKNKKKIMKCVNKKMARAKIDRLCAKKFKSKGGWAKNKKKIMKCVKRRLKK